MDKAVYTQVTGTMNIMAQVARDQGASASFIWLKKLEEVAGEEPYGCLEARFYSETGNPKLGVAAEGGKLLFHVLSPAAEPGYAATLHMWSSIVTAHNKLMRALYPESVKG